jgi:hypothetical protein
VSIDAPARTAVIEIPMLPPRECSPNWRGHWPKRARAVREFRETAAWATRGTGNRNWREYVVMDVEIAWCCGRRQQDDDNAWASLKAARDGISDVLFGGEDRFIVQGTLSQVRGEGVVTVVLRELAQPIPREQAMRNTRQSGSGKSLSQTGRGGGAHDER